MIGNCLKKENGGALKLHVLKCPMWMANDTLCLKQAS
jgi:hypothetical protein